MGKKLKDTDYLPISGRIKVLETRLLTREQMDQLLESRNPGDLARLLQESGYPELDASDPDKLDATLTDVRKKTLLELANGMPDPRYLEIFKLKYDYHNIKAVLKAQAMEVSPDKMLMDMGRVPADVLKKAVLTGDEEKLPSMLAKAAEEARDVLRTTRDPQLSDMVADRWYYQDLCAVAAQIDSPFLCHYVQSDVDAANLRVVVRTRRMRKDSAFLKNALFEGGNIACDRILRASEAGQDALAELYRSTPLRNAAQAGLDARRGDSLTEFEKLCDDALADELSGARLIPFGEAPLLRYLVARETEYTNLRMILIGRQAGIAPDVIRARLRMSSL